LSGIGAAGGGFSRWIDVGGGAFRRRGGVLVGWSDEEAVGGAPASAVVGGDGELSRLDEVAQDPLDVAAAEAGSLLERRLVGDPLASVVGEVGDGEEDH
jgi:hypothetical protein